MKNIIKKQYGSAPVEVCELLAKHGCLDVEMMKVLLWSWSENGTAETKRRLINKVLIRLQNENFIKLVKTFGRDRYFILSKKGAEQLNSLDASEYDYVRDGENLIPPASNKLQKLMYCAWVANKEKNGWHVIGNHMMRSAPYDGWNYRKVDAVAQKVDEKNDVVTILGVVKSDFSATGLKRLEELAYQGSAVEVICVDSQARKMQASIKENYVLSNKARSVSVSISNIRALRS